MITEQIETLTDLAQKEPQDKKAEFHRNLKIGFTVLGIATFIMSGLVNYYTLKKLTK